MAFYSISNLNAFKVLDESLNITYYGCNQEWYNTEWQRLSGCGPTVATNIVYYIGHTQPDLGLNYNINNKEGALSLMEEIWEYVTPTSEGIKTTQMFYEALTTYVKLKGLNFEFEFLDLTEDKSIRPELSEILNFFKKALVNDAPIAFLNLCNGEETNLEEWHWVTIISLEHGEDERSAFIKILDEGQIKEIDFELWHRTTTLGGGFVYFIVSME
ncbi:MAG: hypothetical protein AB9844_06590 [Clostridiaceae bacterium]